MCIFLKWFLSPRLSSWKPWARWSIWARTGQQGEPRANDGNDVDEEETQFEDQQRFSRTFSLAERLPAHPHQHRRLSQHERLPHEEGVRLTSALLEFFMWQFTQVTLECFCAIVELSLVENSFTNEFMCKLFVKQLLYKLSHSVCTRMVLHNSVVTKPLCKFSFWKIYREISSLMEVEFRGMDHKPKCD